MAWSWPELMWPALAIIAICVAIGIHFWWLRRHRETTTTLQHQQAEMANLQREIQKSTLERTAQQEVLFDSMAEGVLILDADQKIQLVNRSLKEMFSLDRDVTDQTPMEAFRVQELGDLLELLKKQPTVEDHEMELPGLDGRWLQVNAAAVLDQRGTQRGAILVFHDVTRIRQLENTRREFVANVSHELRTPLTVIKGYLETLLDGAVNDLPVATRFLNTISKHTDRLTYLIEDILTISRMEDGQIVMNFSPVPLHAAVERILQDLQSVARERKVSLTNRVPNDLVVQADIGRLDQVFTNLVENAIKYGRKEGHVIVGAKVGAKDHVEIWVQDDGPGIPDEARERIFERFYRVDRARSRESGGTGLGLAIVKHIVQTHGGDVQVRSQIGHGTTFSFSLRAGKVE